MNITRHNYEEFFLLYIDNELTPAERAAVEIFLQENPDLRAEMEMLQDTVMQPEQHISFGNISALLKTEETSGTINNTNCEEHFVLYGDNELSSKEKNLVEQFVQRNPQHKDDFELIQQAKLTPDTSIVFPDKSILYRHEKGERVIVMRWFRVAAAAAVILFVGGYGWYSLTNDSDPGKNPVAGMVEQAQPKPQNNAASTTTHTSTAPATDAGTEEAVQQPAAAGNTQQDVSNIKSAVNTIAPSATDINTQKDQVISNKPDDLHVTPYIPPVAEQSVTGRKVDIDPSDITPPASVTAAVAPTTNLQTTPVYVVVDPGSDEENTTNTKKSSLRGLFRKVSRAFDKATNSESGEEDKGGIRIANFSIPVK